MNRLNEFSSPEAEAALKLAVASRESTGVDAQLVAVLNLMAGQAIREELLAALETLKIKHLYLWTGAAPVDTAALSQRGFSLHRAPEQLSSLSAQQAFQQQLDSDRFKFQALSIAMIAKQI